MFGIDKLNLLTQGVLMKFKDLVSLLAANKACRVVFKTNGRNVVSSHNKITSAIKGESVVLVLAEQDKAFYETAEAALAALAGITDADDLGVKVNCAGKDMVLNSADTEENYVVGIVG